MTAAETSYKHGNNPYAVLLPNADYDWSPQYIIHIMFGTQYPQPYTPIFYY